MGRRLIIKHKISLGVGRLMHEELKTFFEGLGLGSLSERLEIREYQASIAKNILEKGNSLVVMPTALGKTFVVLLVMAKMLKEIRDGKRKSGKFLFLTPTRPLAHQQAERIRSLLNLQEEQVKLMTGEMAPEKRQEGWSNKETVCYVATPQTVEFDVLASRMGLKDFSLIVLDEAHRAVKEYSYSFIAKEAGNFDALLIGLTASPSSKREVIDEICYNLQVRNIEIRDENDLDVRKYAHKIKLDWVFVGLPEEFIEVRDLLREMLREVLAKLKLLGVYENLDVKNHKRGLMDLRKRALEELRGDARNYQVLSLQARAMNISHAIDLIEIEGAYSLSKFLKEMGERKTQTKAVRLLLSDPRWLKIQLRVMELVEKGVAHPKFEKMREAVKKEILKGGKIIVFAHYRNVVKRIVEVLNGMEGVKAVEFIGKSKGGMGQKQQQYVMQEFREGRHNVLVATSVGEEGLDVPEVELVVFFEAVPSEIRLIQRRGRTGRVKEGKVIVLVTKESKDEAFFWSSRIKERKMKKMVESMRRGGFVNIEEQDEIIRGEQSRILEY